MLGMPGMNQEAIFGKLESMHEVIKEVNKQFRDSVTFSISFLV